MVGVNRVDQNVAVVAVAVQTLPIDRIHSVVVAVVVVGCVRSFLVVSVDVHWSVQNEMLVVERSMPDRMRNDEIVDHAQRDGDHSTMDRHHDRDH